MLAGRGCAREVAFSATWRAPPNVQEAGLSTAWNGFVSDRQKVLEALRGACLPFLRTPESPRNLIEALFSGARSSADGAYARDLIAPDGGGIWCPSATRTRWRSTGRLDGAREAGRRAAHEDGKQFDARASTAIEAN